MFHNRIASTAFRDSPCLRFAGHGAAIVMLALGMSNVATATTYFNLASVPGPSPSASINFMDNELTTDFEGFYYDYVYLYRQRQHHDGDDTSRCVAGYLCDEWFHI